MKIIFYLLVIISFLGVFNFQATTAHAQGNGKTPVLVELFTSENCVRCPAAERALAMLEKEQPFAQAEIIALYLHVDYLNSPGWSDEFSSPLFSQRQNIYGRRFYMDALYTPHMSVDGTMHFAGGNLEKAQKAISESAKKTKAKIELSRTEDKLKIKISDLPEHENASVFLAVTETDITSKVSRNGELLRHPAVARELKPIAGISAAENKFEIESFLQIPANWKKENLKFVVFVQENQSRKILALGSSK